MYKLPTQGKSIGAKLLFRMKRLISLFAVLACMAVGYAQSSLVATLNHGEAVSVYYGYGALAEAYEAATHGDVITLSSGMFKSVDIAKNITVRGAGAGATDDCTRLDGQFYIYGVPDSVSGHLTLEGLYNDDYVYCGNYSDATDIKNAHFIKCRFSCVFSNMAVKMLNAMFIQCKISTQICLNMAGDKANFFNCYLMSPSFSSDNSSFHTFNNCVLIGDCSSWHNSLFTNCILWDTYSLRIPSSSQASYCLGMNSSPDNYNMFEKLYPYNQYEMVGTSDADLKTIFKTFTGTYSDTETFELTDEAKAKYVGTDGREVGIYGGNFPFTFKSDLPKITKFNVASQSTEDGKLKVEIEVSGVE